MVWLIKDFVDLQNVGLLAGTSENVLQPLLAKACFRPVCFWLDGHFSGGITFKGNSKPPVLHELVVIGASLQKLEKVIALLKTFSAPRETQKIIHLWMFMSTGRNKIA